MNMNRYIYFIYKIFIFKILIMYSDSKYIQLIQNLIYILIKIKERVSNDVIFKILILFFDEIQNINFIL